MLAECNGRLFTSSLHPTQAKTLELTDLEERSLVEKLEVKPSRSRTPEQELQSSGLCEQVGGCCCV